MHVCGVHAPHSCVWIASGWFIVYTSTPPNVHTFSNWMQPNALNQRMKKFIFEVMIGYCQIPYLTISKWNPKEMWCKKRCWNEIGEKSRHRLRCDDSQPPPPLPLPKQVESRSSEVCGRSQIQLAMERLRTYHGGGRLNGLVLHFICTSRVIVDSHSRAVISSFGKFTHCLLAFHSSSNVRPSRGQTETEDCQSNDFMKWTFKVTVWQN